jgi:3-deoxy-D-manno-octulosonate 8-phosphate phosphatase (KDO 8-P phosphatase)
LKARKAAPLARIRLLILDIDGVLTDGRLYFSARGEALKVFHVRDGHGIKLLLAAGVAVAAFSGRRSGAAAARMRELRVPHVMQECLDKVAALHRLTDRLGLDPLDCACICDDTPDLPLMSAVGLAGAVAARVRCANSATPCFAPTQDGADAFPGIHRARGRRIVRQHLDLDHAGAPAANASRRQAVGLARLLSEARRAHRLRPRGQSQYSHRGRAHRSDRPRQ